MLTADDIKKGAALAAKHAGERAELAGRQANEREELADRHRAEAEAAGLIEKRTGSALTTAGQPTKKARR